jgi:hypothetical protein
MFEQLKNEMETDAMVTFKNGKSLYGIIIDFIKDETMFETLRFVPNDSLGLYRATENQKLVMTLESEYVTSVDVNLK